MLNTQASVRTKQEAARYVTGGIVPGSHPGHLYQITSDVVVRRFNYGPKDKGFYVYYDSEKYDAVAAEMKSVWAD